MRSLPARSRPSGSMSPAALDALADALEPLVGRGVPVEHLAQARWSPARRCPRARRRGPAAERWPATRRSAGWPPPRRPRAARRPPARRRGGCGCPRPAPWPPGPRRRRGRRRSRCGRRWPVPAACTSEKTRPAAAPARFAPRGAAAADARAAAFLAHDASSAPVTSSVALDRQTAGLQHLPELPAQVRVAGGEHHRRAQLDGLARVRGTRERCHGARPDPLGHEGRRRGAERRHEALGRHEHGAPLAHARADLADGRGQRAAWARPSPRGPRRRTPRRARRAPRSAPSKLTPGR